MRSRKHFATRSLALVAGALAMATSAHATYTVVDADLYPTKALEGRERPPEVPTTDRFKVGFTKTSATLGPIARTFVDGLVPRMQSAAHIRIVGHIDSAVTTDNDKQHMLAMTRASGLRHYLARAGVPASIIEIDADGTGNSQASSGISSAEVYITDKLDPHYSVTTQARSQIREAAEPAIPHSYRFLPDAQQANAAPAAAPRQSSDERVIEFINRAVQSGQMQPAVAAQILRSLAEAGTSNGTAAAIDGQPSQVAYAAPVPAPHAPARLDIPRWTLDSRLNLKENLNAWATASGWHPVVWEASNFYQVTHTTTLDGAFPDVLKRIADSTGLNICARIADKVVRVTDGNVPCTQ
jgi:outer membrane protein OmpA-like peptidoglycan-associated protein